MTETSACAGAVPSAGMAATQPLPREWVGPRRAMLDFTHLPTFELACGCTRLPGSHLARDGDPPTSPGEDDSFMGVRVYQAYHRAVTFGVCLHADLLTYLHAEYQRADRWRDTS